MYMYDADGYFYYCFFLSISFLSSILTAVLSYHLAWVYTVSKSGSVAASRHHDKTASKSVSHCHH